MLQGAPAAVLVKAQKKKLAFQNQAASLTFAF